MHMPRRRPMWTGFPLLLLCILMAAPQAHASEWHLSFPDATAQAAREGKPILVHFTGSDWCRWCHVLEQEVFDTPHFKAWAENRVVLLVLDFPRKKKLPPALHKQNQALAQHYGIQGYPTVLLLTPNGTKIGESGYRRGGPANWIAEAEAILDTAPVTAPQRAAPVASTPTTGDSAWHPHAPTAAATTLAHRTARARASNATTHAAAEARAHAPATRLQETYIRAEAISFRHRVPLLVALHPHSPEATVPERTLREMNAILTHPSVARASQSDMTVVHLRLPLQGTDRVIWNSVARKHGIQSTAVALLDPDGNLLHLANGDHLQADAFLRGIQPYLPAAHGASPEGNATAHTRPAAHFTDTRPAQRGEWLEDFAQAQDIARALKRPLLVDFTGSDWCGWCTRLKEEVFSTPTFTAYAQRHFVLVQLDFPRLKEQPAALRQQNAALARHYEIQSFPTVLLLHPDGTPLQRMGYVPGGPEAFLHRLESAFAMGR